MLGRQHTNQELIKLMVDKPLWKDWALYQLSGRNNLKGLAETFVRRHSGTLVDAEEVFSDSLYDLDKAIMTGRYQEEGKLEGYFALIVKRRWIKVYQKEKTRIANVEALSDLHLATLPVPPVEGIGAAEFRYYFSLISESCRRLLRLNLERIGHQKIAELLKMKNTKVVSSSITNCRAKLRAKIEAERAKENL